MSTFAPLQFLKSAQNPLVWTAIDNGTDTRTSLIIYYGAINTLPADTELYEVNCIMMHQAEKQLYANTGTSTTPSWEAFGPNSALPQPLVPGTFLFTDGATVYWATSLVGQVQYNATNLNQYGILNFNDFLVASNDVPNTRINVDLDVVALAADATFISAVSSNLDLSTIGGLLDLGTQVTGQLNATNIDQSSLDLSLIGGAIDLSTQVTGLLSSTNIDITNLESTLDLGNIAGAIDLTTQVTGLLPATNIDIAGLITAINLTGDIEVVTDGVTITGNGTTASPLVATGGVSVSGLGINNEIFIDNLNNTVHMAHDVATSRTYLAKASTGTSGETANQFVIYSPNTYGTWEIESTVTSIPRSIGGSGGTIYAITTDTTYVYLLTQYTNGGNTYVDIVRFDLDGTNGVATNVNTFVTASPTGTWQASSIVSGLQSAKNSGAFDVVNGLIYFTTYDYDSGTGNYNVRKFREWSVAGTVYTLTNTFGGGGDIPVLVGTLSDGAFFYTAQQGSLGKVEISGGNIAPVSSYSIPVTNWNVNSSSVTTDYTAIVSSGTSLIMFYLVSDTLYQTPIGGGGATNFYRRYLRADVFEKF